MRPLIEEKWAELVAQQNPELVDRQRLDDFLFGAARVNLDRVRGPLLDLQNRCCFYCSRRVITADVDHFLPWSRHPDNDIDNLVAAHPACNNAKSASIASHDHLEAWVQRVRLTDLDEIANVARWPRRRDRTIGAVNATYLCLPDETRLWVAGHEYELVDRERIMASLASTAA